MITRLSRTLSDWECIEVYLDRRHNGTTIDALAGRYGVSVDVIKCALRNVEKAARERGLRVPERRKNALCNVLSDAECVAMYRARANGAGLEALATEYGVSCPTVKRVIRKIEERGLACA